MNVAQVNAIARDTMRHTPLVTTPDFDRWPPSRALAMQARWNVRVERRFARCIAQALLERALTGWLGILACRLTLAARTEGAVH